MSCKVIVNTERSNERVAYKGSWDDCYCYIAEMYTPEEQMELDITIEDDE